MDNYSRVGLGVRTRVSCASDHHHLLLWGHGNLSNRTDHLANGWLQLKTITIPSRPMDASPKSIAIRHPIGTNDYFSTIGTFRSNG